MLLHQSPGENGILLELGDESKELTMNGFLEQPAEDDVPGFRVCLENGLRHPRAVIFPELDPSIVVYVAEGDGPVVDISHEWITTLRGSSDDAVPAVLARLPELV